jgi:4-hydroxybenzoate polyprenyltransferase
MLDSVQPTAILVSFIGLALLILWETQFMKRQAWSQFLPASLWAVGIGVAIHLVTQGTAWELSPDHMVQIPMLTGSQGFDT